MTDTLLPASVLILVIALLRRVLRGRVSPRVQYALWLLAAARLLLPGPLFPAPVSVAGAAEELRGVFRAERADAPAADIRTAPAQGDAAFFHEAPEEDLPAQQPAARPQAPESSGRDWPAIIRRSGTALAGGVLVLSDVTFYLRLRRTRRRLEPAEGRQAGRLRIYRAEGLPSPCLFGLFRPAVYLNEEALASGRLDHILTHEYIHFRHGDHIWAVVRGVCLALHWYNPLVWWAAILSRRDCELACDEDAIRRLGEEARIDYGQTLLAMVSAKSAAGDLLRTATTMTAGRRTMAERIALIAHRPRTVRTALAALAAVMCCAVVVTFGGGAQAAPEPRPEPASPPAGEETVRPDPAGPPEDAGDPRTLSGPAYVHPSGLFSLTVPEEWLGAVLCVESEDGAAFYDAGRYEEESGAGWLMSVVPQPESWAAEHNQNDFLLEEFGFGGSPYVYVLDVDQDPDGAALSLAPLSVQEDVAGSFRLLADRESVPRLVHDSFRDNMPLALAYLPYLRWSDYREIYGEEEMWALLDALSAFVRDSDVSWGQVHDILSNRSRGDPAIDGAYATAIEEGILWPLYEKNPQRFASVMGSAYLTEEERADAADWLRYLLSEQAGRANDVEDYLTDEEIYAALGLAVLPGVSANVSDVTLRTSGDTFSFLPVDVPGIYAVSYASDDPDVADIANASDGTVIAVGPGQTTVRMRVECSGGPYDFACIVRCAWEWEGEPGSGPDAETVNMWQRGLFGLVFSIPAAPDQELVYDSLDGDGLEAAVLACLEDYAQEYLRINGSAAYNDRLSRVLLDSEIPASPEYGALITVRYRFEILRDREWNGETYTVSPQIGEELETTFTVMDSLNYQDRIRFDAMN